MKLLQYIMYSVCGVLLLAGGFLYLAPQFGIDMGYEMRIVESGSMEPTIMTGAIVFIAPQAEYGIGDVVTFESRGTDVPTTHRIIAREEIEGASLFVTQGDANEDPDTDPLHPSAILGTVRLDIPYLGFLIDFARQPLGFALLVGVPALLIIIDEIETIWREMRRRKGVSKNADDSDEDGAGELAHVPAPVSLRSPERLTRAHDIRAARVRTLAQMPLALFVLGVLASGASFIPGTIAYYTDVSRSLSNFLQGEHIDFKATIDRTDFTITDGVLDEADGAVMLLVEKTKESSVLSYALRVEAMGGDTYLCDRINTLIEIPSPYFGMLTGLSLADIPFDTALVIPLSLADGSFTPGMSCMLDVIISGWNGVHESTFGFTDEERIALSFVVGSSTIEGIAPLRLMEDAPSPAQMDVVAPELTETTETDEVTNPSEGSDEIPTAEEVPVVIETVVTEPESQAPETETGPAETVPPAATEETEDAPPTSEESAGV